MDKQKFFSRRKSLSIIKSKLDSMFRNVLVDEMNNMDKTPKKSVHSLFFISIEMRELYRQIDEMMLYELYNQFLTME
jgi:hypothetical protein